MQSMVKKVVIASLLVALTGCGAARPNKYYQLAVPLAPTSPDTQEQYPFTLTLGPLAASHLYREDRIVYSSDKEQMGLYESERWSEPPTEMIQELLLRSLRQSHRYRAVYPMRSNNHADFVLRGRLLEFKEVSAKPLLARVNFEMDLQEARSGSVVWVYTYNHDEPVTGKNVSDVVAALNRNIQRGITEFNAGLDQYFAARGTK
jgi:cholesterol transport system auxiliary component